MQRDKIIKYCSKYLEVDKFEDGCHNGLQVEGISEISKIITGVSLSEKLIDAAIQKKAEMIMVHHGLFSSSIPSPPIINGVIKKRLKKVLENNINLAGYHLPLDFHEQIGNNVLIAKKLEIRNLKLIDSGCIGNLSKKVLFEDFIKKVNNKLKTKSITVAGGPKYVKTIGVSSGGASPFYQLFLNEGADVFLTGDIREGIVREVEEQGINFINAGHYNTEKLGIKDLGELVAKKFGVVVEFVDISNPV